MTEAEWNEWTDPFPMLEFVRGTASDRKLRLFVVELCRRGSHLLNQPDLFRAAEVAELYVDGLATTEELAAVADALNRYVNSVTPESGLGTLAELAVLWVSDLRLGQDFARNAANCLVTAAVQLDSFSHRQALEAADPGPEIEYPAGAEVMPGLIAWTERINDASAVHDTAIEGGMRASQAALLRDIFGNPFRPVAFDPAWRTSFALALAEGSYADRAFDRLPILADALQDAGCDADEILNHCRGGGEHCRGCWVVDLILGKK